MTFKLKISKFLVKFIKKNTKSSNIEKSRVTMFVIDRNGLTDSFLYVYLVGLRIGRRLLFFYIVKQRLSRQLIKSCVQNYFVRYVIISVHENVGYFSQKLGKVINRA